MARREIAVGVKIDGNAKGFKAAAEDAKKATAALKKKTEQESREMERQFKKVTMALAKVGAALLVAKKSWDVYGKVMQTTNATGDQFAILQDKLRFGANELGRSLATTNFDGLAKRIRDASKAGEEFAKQMDLIFDLQLRLKLIESGANLAMVQQELIFRNTKNPWQVRVAAAEEYLKIVKEFEAQQLYVAEQEMKAAMLQSGVAAAGIEEKRLRYLIESAKVIDSMSKDIQDYVAATSTRGESVLFGGAGGESPETIKRWLDIRRTASDAVKDFAKDYQQFALITDAERSKLVDAWSSLDKIMTESAQNALKPLGTVNGLLGEMEMAVTNINKQMVGVSGKPAGVNVLGGMMMPGLAEGASYIPDNTDLFNRQIAMVNELNSTFENMFNSVEHGFKGMAEAMLSTLKRLVAELLAKAAVLTLLNIIAPGSSLTRKAGSAFLKQYGFLPNAIGAGGGKLPGIGSGMKLEVSGKIAGRDIVLSNNRYNNLLTAST